MSRVNSGASALRNLDENRNRWPQGVALQLEETDLKKGVQNGRQVGHSVRYGWMRVMTMTVAG